MYSIYFLLWSIYLMGFLFDILKDMKFNKAKTNCIVIYCMDYFGCTKLTNHRISLENLAIHVNIFINLAYIKVC